VGHHQARDLVGAQARHAIRQHHLRHAADLLETLGHKREGRRAALIGGEAHKAVAGPGEDGAEHLRATGGRPVDHRVVATIAAAPARLVRRDV